MNMKKLNVYIAGLAVAMLVVGSGAVALADSKKPTPALPDNGNMVLRVGPGGGVLLRGTVQSTSGNSIIVRTWGGDWTVRATSTTKVWPQVTGTGDLNTIAAGDFVGVDGKIVTDQNWTVNANLIRNWTGRQEQKAERKEIKEERHEGEKNGIGRIFEGTISSLGTNTLGLTMANKTYSVHYASSTKIVNRNFSPISVNNLGVGDRMSIWGTASSTDITATVLRDLSVPKQN